MPLIYLRGGPWHHDMREVEDLRPYWKFAVRPPLPADFSLFDPDAPIQQTSYEIATYGYSHYTGGMNVYEYVGKEETSGQFNLQIREVRSR